VKKLFLSLLIIAVVAGNAFAADQWDKLEPLGTRSASDIDAYVDTNNEALDRLLGKYRRGAEIVYASASTITVEAGEVACDNSGSSIRRWRQNTSSTTVTWSDIDTGSETGSTTYYLYAVADTDATTFTVEISTSSTAPSGATYYRRLGSFYNDSSSDIDQFEIVNDDGILDWQMIESKLNLYDSGWFAVSASTDYAKTHNLGTLEAIFCLYYATDSAGAGMQPVNIWHDSSVGQNATYGGMLISGTTTAITARTGQSGVQYYYNSSFQYTSYSSGYYRIIGVALE